MKDYSEIKELLLKFSFLGIKYLNMALIAKYEISIHIFPFCSSLDIG